MLRRADQGFRQGQRKLKAKLVSIGRQGLPGVASRRAGLAADPRAGADHAARRAGQARRCKFVRAIAGPTSRVVATPSPPRSGQKQAAA